MPSRPSGSSSYAPFVQTLIASTSYTPLPDLAELESLHHALQSASSSVVADLEKRQRREQRRKEQEESAAAVTEANEKQHARIMEIERMRLQGQKAKKGSPSSVRVKKERSSLSPAPSEASSVAFKPQTFHSQPITYGSGQLKKKKTKRIQDSDDEAHSQARSATLASPSHLTHTTSTSGLKLKLSSHVPPKSRPGHTSDFSPTPSTSTAAVSNAVGSHIDFSLPTIPSRPLVPVRPGVQRPPKPGPKRQSEVNEDFSNVKAPNQVAFTTYWSGVEPYLREIREDDLAMLGFKVNAPEAYEIPPRGRHYTEIWDEEDGLPGGSTSRYPVPGLRHQALAGTGAVLPHYTPSAEMRDENLVDELRGLGSLTERVVAAVLRDEFTLDQVRQAVEGRGLDSDDLTDDGNRLDVVALEDRMRRELRSVMLLGEHEEFDASNREDDEITSALRQCQRLLYHQTTLNEERKARLASIARQRLAYNDYQSALEGIEKSIEASWSKRVKKHGVLPKKATGSGAPPQRPPVPENLKRLVVVRKEWLDTVGRLMQERSKGEVVGMPTESIFEGIGEETDDNDEMFVEEAMQMETMDVDDAE